MTYLSSRNRSRTCACLGNFTMPRWCEQILLAVNIFTATIAPPTLIALIVKVYTEYPFWYTFFYSIFIETIIICMVICCTECYDECYSNNEEYSVAWEPDVTDVPYGVYSDYVPPQVYSV